MEKNKKNTEEECSSISNGKAVEHANKILCDCQRGKPDRVMGYVSETDEPWRYEIYKVAKEHFDKAVYLLQAETGIHINSRMAEELAENYAAMRAYNYIDATINNIPWYLLYSFPGFPLHHMAVMEHAALHKQLVKLGFLMRKNEMDGFVCIDDKEGYLLIATNYRYHKDRAGHLAEQLDFSVVRPDSAVTDTRLYLPVVRFSVRVHSEYFEELVHSKTWTPVQVLLDITEKYMAP